MAKQRKNFDSMQVFKELERQWNGVVMSQTPEIYEERLALL
uniref:Uncharacterized protein n=1 Tax=Peronospora matthiolae TaxID=2874970 RepID=A0AAV1VGZ8_9STRA